MTKQDKLELKEQYFEVFNEEYQKEPMDEHTYRYEVPQGKISFVNFLTEEEVRTSIDLAIQMVEELSGICNGKTIKSSDLMDRLKAKGILKTEGMWAELLEDKIFEGALWNVYTKIKDHPENDMLFAHSGWYLLDTMMLVRSDVETEK